MRPAHHPEHAFPEQEIMQHRGTGEKRAWSSAAAPVSAPPPKRARAIADSQERCTAHHFGGAVDAAPSQRSLSVDALPSEILCAVMAHVHPTSALVHAASACRRFHEAAAFVRAQRSASRRRAGPHADPIGCAHQLLNAISLDDPNGVVDALDTGHVSFDDLLDPVYLWSAATHNIVARVVGAPSVGSDERPGRPILERVTKDPARTGYYTPLQAATLCGSATCVRALIAMGARMSPCQVGPLVRFVAGTLAWNEIYVSHIPGVIATMDEASRAEARPRMSVAGNSQPGSARVDPIELLSPIMASLPADYLVGTSGRGILTAVSQKAIGRIADMHVDGRERARPRPVHSNEDHRAHRGFVPPNITGLEAAVIDNFAHDVDAVVDDACALAAFLIDRGCRPWCAVRPPFGKRPVEKQDASACNDQQAQRREIDRVTERSLHVELLAKLRPYCAERHTDSAHKESPVSRLGAEAACFLLESLMALYDRLHPPL